MQGTLLEVNLSEGGESWYYRMDARLFPYLDSSHIMSPEDSLSAWERDIALKSHLSLPGIMAHFETPKTAKRRKDEMVKNTLKGISKSDFQTKVVG